MTKAEMIKMIQQHEAKLFLELKQTEKLFGQNSSMAKRNRAEWGTMYELMKILNVKPDFDSPEMEMAMQIDKSMREEDEPGILTKINQGLGLEPGGNPYAE